jgi:hypothetical protein
MTDDIAAARERLAEQFGSDERLLGALPEELTRLVLDDAQRRLDAAAASARTAAEFAAAGEAIRVATRALVDRAAESDDPSAVVRSALSRAESAAGAAQAVMTGTGDGSGVADERVEQLSRSRRSWLPWGRARRRLRFW